MLRLRDESAKTYSLKCQLKLQVRFICWSVSWNFMWEFLVEVLTECLGGNHSYSHIRDSQEHSQLHPNSKFGITLSGVAQALWSFEFSWLICEIRVSTGKLFYHASTSSSIAIVTIESCSAEIWSIPHYERGIPTSSVEHSLLSFMDTCSNFFLFHASLESFLWTFLGNMVLAWNCHLYASSIVSTSARH